MIVLVRARFVPGNSPLPPFTNKVKAAESPPSYRIAPISATLYIPSTLDKTTQLLN